MSKRKWYTKAIYLGVALALTLGLLMIPAAVASPDSEPAASPDFASTCGSLEAGIGYGAVGTDMGTAEWDTTVVRPADTGTYSAKISPGTTSLGLAAAKVPYDGDLTAFSILDETAMVFWTYYDTALKSSFAALWLDTDDDGVADLALLNKGWSTGTIPLAPDTWLDAHLSTAQAPVTWHVYGYTAATGALTSPVTLCDNVSYTGNDYLSLAAWAALDDLTDGTFGDAEVLCVGQMFGGVGGSEGCFVYADDMIIDGVTYGMEPCYYLEPDIAKNVKTADATFTVKDVCGNAIDGTLVSNWLVTKGEGTGEVIVAAGGGTDPGNNYITVRMITTGDCIITCDVDYDRDDQETFVKDVTLDAEKKWGEIDSTELTAWSDTPCEQRPTGTADTEISRANIAVDTEVLVQEKVIANFLPGLVPAPAGGAKVTWWLLENDEDDLAQTALETLLERFDSYYYETGDLGWGYGYGQYAEWALDPTFIPEDILDAIHVLYEADDTEFTHAECADITDTTKTVTETDHFGDPLGEGFTNVNVKFSEVGTTDLAEPVIVVVLADYPLGKNGQNVVAVEYFKFTPGIPPPPAQVKTTQVRWAGEKIVLEKDWTGHTGKLVMFALEEGSIGDLIPVDTFDIASSDSRTVFTMVGTDGVARVMFKTEQQGQVDVECVLYSGNFTADASFDEVAQVFTDGMSVIENTGFLVYYLFLEEVTPWEPTPAPVDPDDPAEFAVDVKGCFWTTSLPGTTREARTITFETDVGTVEYELPAGRYVLPDDWPLMAGPNWRMLRPWMDLMADPGAVNSLYELGPYVVVNSPSGVAALPCIGPFSSLQQWSTLDMWITDAMVTADNAVDMDPFTAGIQTWALRNTVIPDDWVSPFDCPMPPAEIHFVITASVPVIGPSLSEAFKNTGLTYDWPFYASEIPANRLIPPMLCTVEGYWWDSWEFGVWTPEGAYTPNNPITGVLNRESPYWFHIDLEQTPLDDTVLEAYSDNLGTCAVFIDALGGAGSVTIKAFAEYPYLPAKFPPVESDEVTQVWGAIELNPHFVADKVEVDVDETVTFDNLTAGGTWPYTKAEWDFDADGVIDETLTGTHAVVMADVTHAYDTPGVYDVMLTMTDSTPTTRDEKRDDYITVEGEVLPGDANGDGSVNALDITYLEMIIAGLQSETPGADANGDGSVNALDITYLEMIIAGIV